MIFAMTKQHLTQRECVGRMIKRTREVRKETTAVERQNYELTHLAEDSLHSSSAEAGLSRWRSASVVSSQPVLKCCWSSAAILSKVRWLTFFVNSSAGLLFPYTLVYWNSPSPIFLLNPRGPILTRFILPLPLLFAIPNAALDSTNIFLFMTNLH